MAINLLAVLVSVALSMALGAFWYSPLAFAKPWMELTAVTPSQMKGGGHYYLITALGLILEALVLGVLLNLLAVTSVIEGIKVGFFVWSGFVATTSLTNSLFSRRSLNLFLLENGHHLAVILLMSVVLTLWR